jgi:site-specific recombinase XerD
LITLFKRGRVFWIDSTLGGVRTRWSIKTRDRVTAEVIRRQVELEKLAPRAIDKRWPDFEHEFLTWVGPQIAPKTLKEYKHVLGKLTAFLERVDVVSVRDVTIQTITAFTESRLKEVHPFNHRKKTAGGVKYDLRVLHRVFAFALEAGYISANPVRAGNLNSEAGKTLPFAPAEVEKMLKSEYLSGKPYLRAIVLLFLHTGLRIGDVIELRRDAISLSQGAMVLHVKTRKRGSIVRLQLHSDVVAALKEHHRVETEAQKSAPYVFSTENGQPIVSLDKHLRRLFKKVEVAGGHAHRFRDTFAVRLLEKGASLYDVGKLLGISAQTVERHYAPYCRELQQRGTDLINSLDYGVPKLKAASNRR